MSKKLKWGETPWDDWNRDDMLRELQRMYSAISSARAALALCGHGSSSGFWRGGRDSGTGGGALDKCDQVMRQYAKHSEDIYRSFFRYADDLLFENAGFDWRICEQGHMLGAVPPDPPPTTCSLCKGEMRPLRWSDLKRTA